MTSRGNAKENKNGKGAKDCSLSVIVPTGGERSKFNPEDFHRMLETIEAVKSYLDL
jgi:hypothetical protein